MRKLQVLYMDVARSLSGRLSQRCILCTKEFTICMLLPHQRSRVGVARYRAPRTTHHRCIGHLQNDIEWPDTSLLRSPALPPAP